MIKPASHDPRTLRTLGLKLLSQRAYSCNSLKEKLVRAGGEEPDVHALLEDFIRLGFLSDVRYAEHRLQTRSKRYGNHRLTQELRQQGVETAIVDEALSTLEDETHRCRQVWAKKFSQTPESPEEYARQLRFLQYRGFSRDAIQAALKTPKREE